MDRPEEHRGVRRRAPHAELDEEPRDQERRSDEQREIHAVARNSAVCPPTETQQRVPRVIERGGERTAHGLRERQLQEGIAEVLPIVPVQDLPVERRPCLLYTSPSPRDS